MIWGTNVAPYALQDFMEAITEAVTKKLSHLGVEVSLHCYQDDLCISSTTKDSCQKAADLTLDIFKKSGLVISESKTSKEPTTSITWLGFTLSRDRIEIPYSRQEKLHNAFLESVRDRNL
jgi:hypothetical protein